jgi:hypothetical protein
MFKKFKKGGLFSVWTSPFPDDNGRPIQARVNLKNNTFEYKMVIPDDYYTMKINYNTLLVAEEHIKKLELKPVKSENTFSVWTNPFPDSHGKPIQARKNLITNEVELKLVIKESYNSIFTDIQTVKNINIMMQQVDEKHNLLALIEKQQEKINLLEKELSKLNNKQEIISI